MSVFFNGQLLVTPTTASMVNDDAMLNQNLSVTNVVAYLGECEGGPSGKILSFGTPNEAKAVLKSGYLCDAVVAAFSPSAETGAPQTVKAVRINQAVQASYALPLASNNSLSSGNLGTITGLSYSSADLNIKVKVAAGSEHGLYNITVAGGTVDAPWSVPGTDINKSRARLMIKKAHCLVEVTDDGHMLISTDTDSQSGANPLLKTIDLDFARYRTLGELADFLEYVINAAGDKPFLITFDNPDDRKLPATVLDSGRYDSDVANADQSWPLYWSGWAIKAWFDANLSKFVTFTLDEANRQNWKQGLAILDFQPLTAAQPAPVQPADWGKAIDLLDNDRNIQWITPLTADEVVYSMLNNHVITCSLQNKERRAIVGMTPTAATDDEKDNQAVAAAKKLNSPRTSLVHIGHYGYDDLGKLKLRPAFMTAALVSAAFAGLNPGTPLTNKTLNVLGLERDLRNPTDTDKLILGGVMPIENTETGYKVTQSISTWTADSKYNNREQSCGAAIDFSIRNVRQAVDPLRGQKQTPILLSRAISITKGTLTELSRPEPQGPAVLVGDENSPAFRNVTATIEGDVLRIQYEASPAIPNNYILVTMYAVPYSGSATA